MLPKYIIIKIANYVMMSHTVLPLKRVCKLWYRAVNARFYNCKTLPTLMIRIAESRDNAAVSYLLRVMKYDLDAYCHLLPSDYKVDTFCGVKFATDIYTWYATIPPDVFNYLHKCGRLNIDQYKGILEEHPNVRVCKTAAATLALSGRYAMMYYDIPINTLRKLSTISHRIFRRIIETNKSTWLYDPMLDILFTIANTELLREMLNFDCIINCVNTNINITTQNMTHFKMIINRIGYRVDMTQFTEICNREQKQYMHSAKINYIYCFCVVLCAVLMAVKVMNSY